MEQAPFQCVYTNQKVLLQDCKYGYQRYLLEKRDSPFFPGVGARLFSEGLSSVWDYCDFLLTRFMGISGVVQRQQRCGLCQMDLSEFSKEDLADPVP